MKQTWVCGELMSSSSTAYVASQRLRPLGHRDSKPNKSDTHRNVTIPSLRMYSDIPSSKTTRHHIHNFSLHISICCKDFVETVFILQHAPFYIVEAIANKVRGNPLWPRVVSSLCSDLEYRFGCCKVHRYPLIDIIMSSWPCTWKQLYSSKTYFESKQKMKDLMNLIDVRYNK